MLRNYKLQLQLVKMKGQKQQYSFTQNSSFFMKDCIFNSPHPASIVLPPRFP